MPTLSRNLDLEKCPHCSIDNPNLNQINSFETRNHKGQNNRAWIVYACSRCGGVVTASSIAFGAEIMDYYPQIYKVDNSIPIKARSFLQQAYNTIHAPSGCIMLCASSLDSMLKEKGYSKGSLNERINQASDDHLITEDMKTWAHEVRLDANDQRHADDDAGLPEIEDAKRTLEFTRAFAEYLFVLPSKVIKGLQRVV